MKIIDQKALVAALIIACGNDANAMDLDPTTPPSSTVTAVDAPVAPSSTTAAGAALGGLSGVFELTEFPQKKISLLKQTGSIKVPAVGLSNGTPLVLKHRVVKVVEDSGSELDSE